MAVGATVTVNVRARVTAPSGATIVNSATVGESDSSAPGDPVLVNNDASTPATTVSANLPATGWALMARWLQIAGVALGLGALVVVFARRRRPSLG
ncbi:MAG: LPXTG cell wall anchor domain-containing protein [Ilumatobacteraceae bacterium]